MKNLKKTFVIGLALVFALGLGIMLTGCGGGSGSESSPLSQRSPSGSR